MDPKHHVDNQHPIVLALTGASGSVYAVRLLQQLLLSHAHVHLICSPSAGIVMKQELNIQLNLDAVRNASRDPLSSMHATQGIAPLLTYVWPEHAERWGQCPDLSEVNRSNRLLVHHYQDYMAPVASGSFLTRGMVICPCSGATLSGVVHAAGNNLIQRDGRCAS